MRLRSVDVAGLHAEGMTHNFLGVRFQIKHIHCKPCRPKYVLCSFVFKILLRFTNSTTPSTPF